MENVLAKNVLWIRLFNSCILFLLLVGARCQQSAWWRAAQDPSLRQRRPRIQGDFHFWNLFSSTVCDIIRFELCEVNIENSNLLQQSAELQAVDTGVIIACDGVWDVTTDSEVRFRLFVGLVGWLVEVWGWLALDVGIWTRNVCLELKMPSPRELIQYST